MRRHRNRQSCYARFLLIFLIVAGLAIEAAGQAVSAPAAAKPQSPGELRERIALLLDQPQFASARWGALIEKDDRVIFERDADKSFMPASNMKLYTTAPALDAFGPDYRVRTSVYATRLPGRDGTLRGDLIFYGRGDPNLSARFAPAESFDLDQFRPAELIPAIESLADQIKARRIKRINGRLIGDDSYFASARLGPGWEWDDAQFYYGAEVSALTVNDNVVSLVVTPGRRAGAPPAIQVMPKTSYVTIVNRAQTTTAGVTRIGVDRPLNSNVIEIFGTIPLSAAKFEINIAVHDPAGFAATLLKEALLRRGIRVTGRLARLDAVARLARPFDETKLTEIAGIDSEPLSIILKVINKPSQNLHTELLLRQLGLAPGGPATLDDYGRPRTSDARGNDARREFLRRAGIDLVPLILRDGSGLARQDLITPRATVRLLAFMMKHPHFAVFRDSLPIAGQDGTLERRMRETPAAGRVFAKTGTLSQVNALSGYLTTRRGETLVFSLIGNNYTGPGREVTSVFDQICALLADYEGEF